jgi:succinyl-CoA synthetase beta subunit
LLLCGNKEEESLKILHEGTKDLKHKSPIEIYGGDKVYETEFLAGRLKAMIMDYRAKRGIKEG